MVLPGRDATRIEQPDSGARALRVERLERSGGARWAVASALLDSSQRVAVSARGEVVRVLGAPGTGKSTVCVHAVVDRVTAGEVRPHEALVLAPTRVAAARLRSALTTTLAATTSAPLVCSVQAFAYGVLRRDATERGEPTPRLLSGPEQDVVLRELLAGHDAGVGRVPQWPSGLLEAVRTRGFRGELRDLLMRAVEHGLDAEGLAALGRARGMPEWVAAADVLAEYDEVTALSTPGGYDPAWIITAVADLLEDDPEVLARVRQDTRVVVVDDAQELTAPAARLLSVLRAPDVQIVLVGDPDAATQTFRGADPHLMSDLTADRSCVLDTSWRLPAELTDVAARVGSRIGSAGSVVHRFGIVDAPLAPALDTSTVETAPPAGDGRQSNRGDARDERPLPGGARQPALFSLGEPDADDEPRAHDVETMQAQSSSAGAPGTASEAAESSTPAATEAPAASSALPSEPNRPRGTADTAILHTSAGEARFIAARLRRAHLLEGVPWSRMAVIVRGAGRSATMRRVLSGEGVPVDVPGAHVPLRDEPAVRPFLRCFEVALAVAVGEPSGLDAETVLDLLASPLGSTDSLAVRRLLRALRRAEGRGTDQAREDGHDLGHAATRTTDDLLVAAMLGDPVLDTLEEGTPSAGLRRLRAVLAAGVDAAGRDGAEWAPGVTAETVLWAMWQASGLAEPWRRAALAGSRRADRDLDALVALTDAATRYVDRLPHRGPDGFLEHVGGQDVAGDTLVARAPGDDCVTLTTPAGAAGLEWDLVVVAGVQEGVWPDLRLRGSLLGSAALVDALTGRDTAGSQARVAVRDDETRMFHVAVTRARSSLLVTAVASEDEMPSSFLDLVDGAHETREFAPLPEPMSLPDVVAALRRRLSESALHTLEAGHGLDAGEAGVPTPSPEQAAVAGLLARLAQAGVPGAHPGQWWGLRDLSDDRPRRAPQDRLTISPSKVEAFADCQLRWLLSASGGNAGGGSVAGSLGTLVHDIAATVDNGDHGALAAELERRWPELDLPEGWISRRQFARARAMLDRLTRLHTQSLAAGWQVVGTEIDVQVPLGRALVRGRIDRLERDEQGRLRVVDLKTGSSKPANAALPTHPQLGAYQVAVEEGAFGDLGRESAGAALMQIGLGGGVRGDVQVQQRLSAAEDPQWAHRLLTETAEGMAGSRFRATPGTWCRVCESRFSCPMQPEGEALR